MKKYILIAILLVVCSCVMDNNPSQIVIQSKECEWYYSTDCYLSKGNDSILLYHTYNPVKLDTILMTDSGTNLFVLEEDIFSEEATFSYIVYDEENIFLYKSSLNETLNFLTNSELRLSEMRVNKPIFRVDSISLDLKKLYVRYHINGKHNVLELYPVGEPPYTRE